MVRGRGLTLIEVVILVLIVGLAAGVLLPLLAAARERSRRERCAGNLKSIAYCLDLYASDHGELFPSYGVAPSTADKAAVTDPAIANPMASLGMLYPDYFSDGKVVICPSAGAAKPVETDLTPTGLTLLANGAREFDTLFTSKHSDYAYDPGHTAAHSASVAVAADAGSPGRKSLNHGGKGQNVLYIGSNVEWKSPPYCGYEQDDIYAPGFTSPSGADVVTSLSNKTLHSYVRQ
ncbi:MAG: type II secretion system protein [Planctomycetota bacterium]|jgi:type II secretory pathway pseudopilin PulG